MTVFVSDAGDSVSRQVDDVLQAIAALRNEGRIGEALERVRAAGGSIFGPQWRTFDHTDAEVTARLLRTVDRILGAAEILQATGELYALREEPDAARACWRRALELCLETVLSSTAPDPRALSMIATLRTKADEWRLARRYRGVLDAP